MGGAPARVLSRTAVCPALLAAAALWLPACGSSAALPPMPPALPATAVGYLPSHVSRVTSTDLAQDTTLSGMAGRLSGWGYTTGSERMFQGTSHRLEVVVARTLEFRTAAGARGFVGFVGSHAAAYVGQVPQVRPLREDGRSGVLIVAPQCACHMAQPALLAVVGSGRRVSWLEINGPAATDRALEALLARMP
jgi:hypothetical protein